MIEQLKEFTVFDGVKEKKLEKIAKICRVRKIEKGATVFSSGDPAERLFLTVKGALDLCSREAYKQVETDVCIEHVTKGEAFGWSALTPPFKYHLTARVVEDAELIEIDREDIERICEEDSDTGYTLMHNIAVIVGRRLASSQRIIRDLIQQDLKERETTT
jgi:CRP/FNR family cyclic AMP-dependent transcriptional regulator